MDGAFLKKATDNGETGAETCLRNSEVGYASKKQSLEAKLVVPRMMHTQRVLRITQQLIPTQITPPN